MAVSITGTHHLSLTGESKSDLADIAAYVSLARE